jgi:ketosteroid isomerase-like protein
VHITNAIACAVLITSFCSLVADGQPQDRQTIREIDAAWSLALQQKDLDKVISNYADDASFLPPDEPIIRGQVNIREWFAKRVAMPGYSATFAPTNIVVAKSGDIAYELGTFHVRVDDKSGKPIEYSGKHLVTWEKRGGRWKVVAESINQDSPHVQR